jgi:hypothetical protein
MYGVSGYPQMKQVKLSLLAETHEWRLARLFKFSMSPTNRDILL